KTSRRLTKKPSRRYWPATESTAGAGFELRMARGSIWSRSESRTCWKCSEANHDATRAGRERQAFESLAPSALRQPELAESQRLVLSTPRATLEYIRFAQ